MEEIIPENFTSSLEEIIKTLEVKGGYDDVVKKFRDELEYIEDELD